MNECRKQWLNDLITIARPVLYRLSEGRLKKAMPVYHHPDSHDREDYTYLEALGRTLMGMAPWLETPCEDAQEEALRVQWAQVAREALKKAVNPASPDVMNFETGFQPLVDAAFLAQALLRAPNELYRKLDEGTQEQLVKKLKSTRTRKPFYCNWLLFSAIIEVFLREIGEPDWDAMRIDYALKQHEQWYVGDGAYGDGPDFHWDYYNSFVIQPMLVDIITHIEHVSPDWDAMHAPVLRRAARYAAILEKLIAPDGSYPVLGRSSCYRFGAFQALSQAALIGNLPADLPPQQVRCALTAVLHRVMAYPLFDEDGWLTIGVCGTQPGLGEAYISTGSLYLCTALFLPLGLPETHPFWCEADVPYTAQKIWSGADVSADHAL